MPKNDIWNLDVKLKKKKKKNRLLDNLRKNEYQTIFFFLNIPIFKLSKWFTSTQLCLKMVVIRVFYFLIDGTN